MRGAWLNYVGSGACLKRARLDELLRGDFVHTLCLEGCHLLFGGSSCSGLKQPLHTTTNVQNNNKHVEQTNKSHQTCVCALLSVLVGGSIVACPLQPSHSTDQKRSNTPKRSTNTPQQIPKHKAPKPTTTKHQQDRVSHATSVLRTGGLDVIFGIRARAGPSTSTGWRHCG